MLRIEGPLVVPHMPGNVPDPLLLVVRMFQTYVGVANTGRHPCHPLHGLVSARGAGSWEQVVVDALACIPYCGSLTCFSDLARHWSLSAKFCTSNSDVALDGFCYGRCHR